MLEMLKARKEALQERGVKGFTLMEMLIVIAIIAVLVAIAIPVLGSQLENAREATDAANIRSAYAEVAAKALQDPATAQSVTVDKVQTVEGWGNTSIKEIAGIAIGDIESTDDTVIAYTTTGTNAGQVTIDGKVASNTN